MSSLYVKKPEILQIYQEIIGVKCYRVYLKVVLLCDSALRRNITKPSSYGYIRWLCRRIPQRISNTPVEHPPCRPVF